MKKIFTLLVFSISLNAVRSQSTTVVISQVYGGGGGSTGTYLYDYVELHNVSTASQLLTGFSIQYGSATGQFAAIAGNLYAIPTGTTIPAGGYLLIQLGGAGTGGAALPITPDLVTTSVAMSASSGKVALSSQVTALGCGATATPCALPASNIIDVVAYGAANNSEGGLPVNNGVALDNTKGVVRKTAGCTDTEINNVDFDVVTAPVPHNASSAINICPTPVPVKLEYIKGQKASSGIALNWKVTCLSTNIKMEIERSSTTKGFASINAIAATQARCAQPFDFVDPAPLKGRNYYRLKMINIDGKISYSPIVAINGSKGLDFVGLYPSLVSAKTSLSISADKNGTIEIIITDMAGRIVKRAKSPITAGASLVDIDCANLAPGVYNLTGIADDASTSSIRFVKQ